MRATITISKLLYMESIKMIMIIEEIIYHKYTYIYTHIQRFRCNAICIHISKMIYIIQEGY